MAVMKSTSMATESPATIRILVALDESPRSTAALSAAAALAEELQAELAGLFVEDINLQHLISLPFTREFSPLSGERRALTLWEIERTWQHEAQTLQRQLAEAAERMRLQWSFHVTRGKVFTEVNTMAQSYDLIILGRRPLISVMDIARMTYRVSTILPRVNPDPILVLFETEPTSSHSLDLGVMLARKHGAELVLLIHSVSESDYLSACADAQAAIRKRKFSARCLRLASIETGSLVQATHTENAGCLLLADRGRFLSEHGLAQGLEEIECPIILTR